MPSSHGYCTSIIALKALFVKKGSTKSDIKKFIEHATRALEVKIKDEKGASRLVIVCPTWYSYFREPRQATTCFFNSFTPSPRNTDPIAAPLALLPTVEPNVAFSIDVLAIVAHKRLAYMWTHMDCTREL